MSDLMKPDVSRGEPAPGRSQAGRHAYTEPQSCTRLPDLAREELTLLQHIVDGADDVELAQLLGHSERSLYKALADLWDDLGVDSREAATELALDLKAFRTAAPTRASGRS